MSFAHLTIATRDVNATCDFFSQTLGWPPIHPPSNSPLELGWLEIAPGQQLHVLRVDDFEPSLFEEEFGRHFAIFHAGTDFESLKQRLSQHGAELIDAVRPTPFERFFFRDPNGYVFEVIAEEQYVIER